MKTSVKVFACAAMASIAFLACEDTGINNNIEQDGSISSSSSVLFSSSSEPSSSSEKPVKDNRVVSYKFVGADDSHYIQQQLGEDWYGAGFVTDEKILKFWFPHIFNDEYVKSAECSYFAYYHVTNSTNSSACYNILSQNMIKFIYCSDPEDTGIITGDILWRAMLICDDKDWTLKESLNVSCDIREVPQCLYIDPNWKCNTDPDWEKIYF